MFPDYTNSILNISASLASHLWITSFYKPLECLSFDSETVVFLLIDWLGANFIDKNKWFLSENKRHVVTSVFPSSTSAAIPSYLFTVPPAEHWSTWWYMYMRELGCIINPLPTWTAVWQYDLKKEHWHNSFLFSQSSVFSTHEGTVFITKSSFQWSLLNTNVMDEKKTLWYDDFEWYISSIVSCLLNDSTKSLIYAYRPWFDEICHKYWPSSSQAQDHYQMINNAFANLPTSIWSTKINYVCSSDHWFIDTPENKKILASSHSKLLDLLYVPPCWERRFVYLYCLAENKQKLQKYYDMYLSKYFELYESSYLLKKWVFWNTNSLHKEFTNRIWDFVMIARDDYVRENDSLWTKSYKYWDHGWISLDEMLVPVCAR